MVVTSEAIIASYQVSTKPGQVCHVHPNQIQDWKKRLVEGAEDVFGGNAIEAQHNEKEVEKLHAKIGQLAMENDFLSKVLGRDR